MIPTTDHCVKGKSTERGKRSEVRGARGEKMNECVEDRGFIGM